MRKRFNRSIIASSDTYKVHSHLLLLRENHEANKEYFENIKGTIMVTKKQESDLIKRNYFAKCFGKLVKITREDALRLGADLVITQ